MRFQWSSDEGLREVFLYLLPEGALADDDALRSFVVEVQDAASIAQNLPALEVSMHRIAGERGLVASLFAGPDHTAPFGDRVSLGFRPGITRS